MEVVIAVGLAGNSVLAGVVAGRTEVDVVGGVADKSVLVATILVGAKVAVA